MLNAPSQSHQPDGAGQLLSSMTMIARLCMLFACLAAAPASAGEPAALNAELLKLCGSHDSALSDIEALVAQGADVLMTNEHGETLLHIASIFGRVDVLEWLVSECEKHQEVVGTINKRATGKHSLRMAPLHWWMWHGHYEGVELLLVLGADYNMVVDTEDGRHMTPMDIAHAMQRQNYIDLLAQMGALTYDELARAGEM